MHQPENCVASDEEEDDMRQFSFILSMSLIIFQFTGHQIMNLGESNGGSVVNMIKFYPINTGLIASILLF